MSWPIFFAERAWSLFVDDGLLAVLAVVWTGLLGLLFSRWGLGAANPGWGTPLLALGLIALLVASVIRAARRAAAARTML